MPLLLAEVPVVVGELAGAEAGLIGAGSALISPAGIAGIAGAMLLGQALKNYFNDKPATEELNVSSIPEQVTIEENIFWAPISYQPSTSVPPHQPQIVPEYPANTFDGVMSSIATWDRETPHPLLSNIADKLISDLENAVQASAIKNGLSDTSKPDLSSLKPALIADMAKTATKQASGASAPPPGVSEQKTADAQQATADGLSTLAGTDPNNTDGTGSIGSIATVLGIIAQVLGQIRDIFSTNFSITVNIGANSECQPIKLCEDLTSLPISLDQNFFNTLGFFLQSFHAVNKQEMTEVFEKFFESSNVLGNRKTQGKMTLTEVMRDKIVSIENEEMYTGSGDIEI